MSRELPKDDYNTSKFSKFLEGRISKKEFDYSNLRVDFYENTYAQRIKEYLLGEVELEEKRKLALTMKFGKEVINYWHIEFLKETTYEEGGCYIELEKDGEKFLIQVSKAFFRGGIFSGENYRISKEDFWDFIIGNIEKTIELDLSGWTITKEYFDIDKFS